MVENINTCLNFLVNLGVSVDGVTAKEIRDGNLKAILGLFFSLSRYKQAQKAAAASLNNSPAAPTTPNANTKTMPVATSASNDAHSKLPAPLNKPSVRVSAPAQKDVLSSIPAPSSVGSIPRRGNHVDRNAKSASGIAGNTGSSSLSQKPSLSTNSSRSGSPHTGASSFIPQPKSSAVVTRDRPGNDKPHSRPSSTASSSSISHLPVKSAGGVPLRNNTPSSANSPGGASLAAKAANHPNSNSMLDKFKFFNSKDKHADKTKVGAVSKRTSSSSGFSSARSEKSDSSASLCSDKRNSLAGFDAAPAENGTETSHQQPQQSSNANSGPSTNQSSSSSSPKVVVKNLARKTFGRTGNKHGTASKSSSATAKEPEDQKEAKTQKAASAAQSTEVPSENSSHKEQPPSRIRPLNGTNSRPPSTGNDASSSSSAPQPDVNGGDINSRLQKPSPAASSNCSSTKQPEHPSTPPRSPTTIDSDTILRHPGSARNSRASDSGSEAAVCGSSSTSAMSNSSATGTSSGVNSSIPKPTAAVKGTSKVSKDNNRSPVSSPVNETMSSSATKESLKSPEERSSSEQQQQRTPSEGMKKSSSKEECQITKSHDESRTTSTLPKSDRSKSDRSGSNQSISIAMVSPIMSTNHSFSQSNKERSQSSMSSDSSTSIQSKIEASDVRLVGGTDSTVKSQSAGTKQLNASRQKTTSESNNNSVESNNKLNSQDSSVSEEGDDVMVNIKPMQPLNRTSGYGYMRNLGPFASTRSMSSRLHVPVLRMQSDSSGCGRMGLSRHVMAASHDMSKIYGVPVKRTLSNGGGLVEADYIADMEAMDIAAGYMSDGDVLRCAGPVSKIEDINSGYMSEGGASLYARRLAARGKDTNFLSAKDPKFINVLQDDRNFNASQKTAVRLGFDDSSSISSGISDTFAEISTNDNLTDSSLSSENNLYGCLKRQHHHHHHTPPTSSRDANPNKFVDKAGKKVDSSSSGIIISAPSSGTTVATSVSSVVTVPSSSSRSRSSNVKKTDSSMQTESSAFHHASSANWKKYVQQQHDQHHLKNSHSEGSGGKSSSHEKSSSKEKKSGSSSSSKKTSSSTDKNEGHKSSKSKQVIVVKGGEEVKLRAYIDGDNLSDKSSRSGRSTSPKPLKGSSESLAISNRSADSRKLSSSGRSPLNPAGHVFISSKRPASTSSVSSNGSSSKSGSKTHKKDGKDLLEVSHPHGSSSLTRTGEIVIGNKNTLERKIKVCANTQTTVHDFYSSAHSDSEYSSLGRSKHSSKQYLLTSPTLGGMRDRIYGTRSMINGSPPTYASTANSDYVMLSGFHSSPGGYSSRDRSGPRLSVPMKDSDNYVTLDHTTMTASNSPYAWLRHSPNSGTSVASAPVGTGMTEAESMESLSSTTSSAHAQHAQGNCSLTHARLLLHQREMSSSPQMSRSNSIRSTKSEKVYPSMLHRSEDSGKQLCPSPVHSVNGSAQNSSRYMYPLSPMNTSQSHGSGPGARSSLSMSHYMGGLLSKMGNKDDETHGSSLSLVSTSSSIYSTAEEKQAHEIRKLKKELDQANEKVATLTSQLTTNAHMVAAFEQSLSNMTSRLQQLTATAEQKDSELTELRSTIEALKKQSAEAGLTKMALQSMQAVQRTLQEHRMSRQLSTDSMSSVNSASSACSANSMKSGDNSKKKKKKGWLRSSFSKAFSRSKKNRNGSVSDVEDIRQFQSDSSTPNSPLLGVPHANGGINGQGLKSSHSSSAIYEKDDEPDAVKDLKKQLREKDMVLTDIRLEALSSAHQLDNLKDTVNKMRNEMVSLKQDNDRLQRIVSNKSLTSSQSSLPLQNSVESLEKRLSASEHSGSPSVDMYLNDAATDRDGKRVTISVYLGSHGNHEKFSSKSESAAEVQVGSVSVSGKTKWDLLDNVVKRAFKEYVLRVDPVSNLGLNAESVLSYHVGDITRSKEMELPELLPCGYLVGDLSQIRITLKGTQQNSVDGIAFETLIPKSIVQRYISLLTEHRRIILCGPSGTGKTFLAQKLAEFLVLRSGKDVTAGAIATFSVDHKSAKELRQYLSNVAEQCESSNASDLPTVIILDNLHHVGSLGEVFNGFLSAKYQKCPYIIGTMNQATCSTTNLQLHHNFRWVLCANHMEPVKGFLGRYLRRKLIEEEVKTGVRHPELNKVIDWMPKAWQHLNKFLETHSSSDVTIGPRLFLSCPVDVSSAQVWFTDLWNYSIVPYLLEAVREGLQLYGRRAPWEDPAEWVHQTYPWPAPAEGEWPQLLRLRPEDVGYDGHGGSGLAAKPATNQNEVEADPLLNMLMRLQEAASYSSPQSNDSDSTSLDGHSSGGLNTEDLINTGLESTL